MICMYVRMRVCSCRFTYVHIHVHNWLIFLLYKSLNVCVCVLVSGIYKNKQKVDMILGTWQNENTNKFNSIDVSFFKTLERLGLWCPVCHPDSTFARWHKLWHPLSVVSSVPLLTHARCAQCYPLIPLRLASLILATAGEGTESPNRALHTVIMESHNRQRVFLSFLFAHQVRAKCRSRFLHQVRGCPQQR